jgi:DNA polymerase-3 subunit beta
MRVQCNGLDFADAVAKVNKAISTRTVNALLECIKIKAEFGALTLTATDMDLTIEKRILADVEIEGTVVVPGKLIGDWLRRITTEQVQMTLKGSVLTLRAGDADASLNTLHGDEFPVIRVLESAESFQIQSKALRDLLAKIKFSVAIDDARPILKGCLIDCNGPQGLVTGVALDGYRMAKCVKPVVVNNAAFRCVVPARSVEELHNLLPDSDELVTVTRHKSSLMVQTTDAKLFTRLLEGEFINYERVLPHDFTTDVIVDKASLENSLGRASLMSRIEKNNLVTFALTQNVLALSSESDSGRASEKVPVKLTGDEFTLVFNVRYFLDALRTVDDGFIKLQFIRPDAPCVATSVQPDGDYLYLFLPIRTPR